MEQSIENDVTRNSYMHNNK